MSPYLKLLVFLFVYCHVSGVRAQEDYLLEADLTTTKDGLSGITIYGIGQDDRGFVWASTMQGVDRFDGNKFTLYTSNELGFKNKLINRLYTGQDHLLWLFHNANNPAGCNCKPFPIQDFAVLNTKLEQAIPQAQLVELKQFFEKNEYWLPKISGQPKRIWLSTQKGALWTYERGAFQRISNELGGLTRHVVNQKNGLLIANNQRLIQASLSGEVLQSVEFQDPILDIWEGNQDTLWVATRKDKEGTAAQLWKVDPNFNRTAFSFSRGGQKIAIPLHLDDGDYLYRTQKGFWLVVSNFYGFLFDPSGREIFQLNERFDKEYSFNFRGIVELDNNLLIGASGGIINLAIKNNPFKPIYRDSTTIFIDSRGITQGPNRSILFNATYFYQVDSNYQNLQLVRDTLGPAGFGIYYANGTLLNGERTGQVMQISGPNLSKGDKTSFPIVEKGMVFTIHPTKRDQLFWIGGEFGLYQIDLKNQKVSSFSVFNEHPELAGTTVFDIYENQVGYWLSTSSGIVLVSEKEGIIRIYNQASGDLPYDKIYHLYEDQTGIFWLASSGAGMIKWEPSLKQQGESSYQVYNTTHGLSHDVIYAVYEDAMNRLWLPSNRGLMLFDKKTERVITFLEKDGLPHAEFNRTSHYQADDGTLFFGGLGGIVAFDPKDMNDAFEMDAPLVFTSFKVLEQAAEKGK